MGNDFIKTFESLDRLRHGRLESPQPQTDSALEPQMALLRTWQMERLAQTHADLLAGERYGPACRFFLTDLYAPQDFSQRDQAFHQLYGSLRRYLPPPLIQILKNAIDLNDLTADLDQALLASLVNDLQMTTTITSEMYAEAYRRCDNYDDRKLQIEKLVENGRNIDRIVHLPLIGLALRLAHTPAHRAGWGAVQDFLERGYTAFRQMKGAEKFLDTIQQREMEILDQIYFSPNRSKTARWSE